MPSVTTTCPSLELDSLMDPSIQEKWLQSGGGVGCKNTGTNGVVTHDPPPHIKGILVQFP